MDLWMPRMHLCARGWLRVNHNWYESAVSSSPQTCHYCIKQEFGVLGHHVSCLQHLLLICCLQKCVGILLGIFHGLYQLLSHVHLERKLENNNILVAYFTYECYTIEVGKEREKERRITSWCDWTGIRHQLYAPCQHLNKSHDVMWPTYLNKLSSWGPVSRQHSWWEQHVQLQWWQCLSGGPTSYMSCHRRLWTPSFHPLV